VTIKKQKNKHMKIKKNIALSDSGFIFNPSTGESFSVNPIGAEMLKMLKDGKEKDDIKKAILEKYQTDDATFERDYYDFVNVLNHYLLTEIDG
jgi:hypothetical protein